MIEHLPHRQQNYVSRVIQGGLLWEFTRQGAMYFLLLWHGLFALDWLRFAKTPEPPTFWEAYWRFGREHVDLLVCAAAILPLAYWNILRLTHRIAGPLERFRQALEQLQRGETVRPVTLRRDDLLIEYQKAFNRYLASLEQEEGSQEPPAE